MRNSPSRIQVITNVEIIPDPGVKKENDERQPTECTTLLRKSQPRAESNGSLESKVESIYINNIQNNITVTQNIEGQRGNNCLGCGCCGVELEEDIESQNENSTSKSSKRSSSKKFTRGETCKCFNVGLTLAIFILTGMTHSVLE